MLDPRFKDNFFASNIIKTTMKEILEEEIRKIAPGEDNSSHEVRQRPPSPPMQKHAKKDALLTMHYNREFRA